MVAASRPAYDASRDHDLLPEPSGRARPRRATRRAVAGGAARHRMRTIIGGPAAEPSAPDERGESARPRVLVFAFACEPGRGSEPGAGWGTVRALSTFADCVVLVGPEHAAGISRWQASGGRPGLTFVVVPEARWPGPGRGGRVAPFIAYLRWLPRAYEA